MYPDNNKDMKQTLNENDEESLLIRDSLNNITKSCDFKILSIDGGGIKGLYAAKLLGQIEEHTGTLVGEHFDMLCGTSTGGLIALAITKGIPCKEVARFYEEQGPLIFPYEHRDERWYRKLRQILWGSKYNNDSLIQAIKELINDYETMNSCNHIMCIPAYNLTAGQPKIFKKPFAQYHVDGNHKILDVALATSAAPTYLPAVKIASELYVDGGIFSNDPSMIGYTEAKDHFIGKTIPSDNRIEYSSVSMLSIGLPGDPQGELPDISTNRSFLQWREKLILKATSGMDFITSYQVKKLIECGGGRYFRLEPPQLNSKQLQILQMDNSSENTINMLSTYGQRLGDHYTSSAWPEIEDFFNDYKTIKF